MYYISIIIGASVYIGYQFGADSGIIALAALACVYGKDIADELKGN